MENIVIPKRMVARKEVITCNIYLFGNNGDENIKHKRSENISLSSNNNNEILDSHQLIVIILEYDKDTMEK